MSGHIFGDEIQIAFPTVEFLLFQLASTTCPEPLGVYLFFPCEMGTNKKINIYNLECMVGQTPSLKACILSPESLLTPDTVFPFTIYQYSDKLLVWT